MLWDKVVDRITSHLKVSGSPPWAQVLRSLSPPNYNRYLAQVRESEGHSAEVTETTFYLHFCLVLIETALVVLLTPLYMAIIPKQRRSH